MWEYIQSWYSGSAGEYVVTSAGEVYNSATGMVVGWYDSATDTIYDTSSGVTEAISGAGVIVYEDLKAGLTEFGELAEHGVDVIGSGIGAADKALNIASVIMIGGIALGAYLYFFGGKTAIAKSLR